MGIICSDLFFYFFRNYFFFLGRFIFSRGALPLYLTFHHERHKMEVQEELTEELVPIYGVKSRVIGGRFPGMRGATYEAALEFRGHALRSRQEDPIRYGVLDGEDEEDIHIELYFLDSNDRSGFMKKNHDIHEDLPEPVRHKHKPKFEDSIARYRLPESRLKPILDSDFQNCTPPESVDHDQSVQSLSAFGSGKSRKRTSSSSVSSSSRISAGLSGGATPTQQRARRMLFKWQTFEKQIAGAKMQSCHIVPSSDTHVKLENDPNNFVGGYSDFHEGFDGHHSDPPVPRFVVEYVRLEDAPKQVDEDGKEREKVRVRMRFVSADVAATWRPLFEPRFKEDCVFKRDGTIEGFMHVRSANWFQVRLEEKIAITKGKWRERGLV